MINDSVITKVLGGEDWMVKLSNLCGLQEVARRLMASIIAYCSQQWGLARA